MTRAAVAFTTWAYALARTSAGKQGATTYLVPAVTILLGWAILGETPPLLALTGGLLCLGGVALTRRRRRATGNSATRAKPTHGSAAGASLGSDDRMLCQRQW